MANTVLTILKSRRLKLKHSRYLFYFSSTNPRQMWVPLLLDLDRRRGDGRGRDAGAGGGGRQWGQLSPKLGSFGISPPPPNFGLSLSFIYTFVCLCT